MLALGCLNLEIIRAARGLSLFALINSAGAVLIKFILKMWLPLIVQKSNKIAESKNPRLFDWRNIFKYGYP